MNQNSNQVLVSAAGVMLEKAINFDNDSNYSQALIYYKEGIQILIDTMKEIQSKDEKNALRLKIEHYMTRAEILKKKIKISDDPQLEHQQIIIEDNSTGHSYERVFGKYLNSIVTEIEVSDPYIRIFHQCQNFLRFCELAVKSCENLKRVILITCEDKPEQRKWFYDLQEDLRERFRIVFDVRYSSTLHDREIRLNNGWVIKIGRGLDYFKNTDHKFMLGYHDQDLRRCHETTVDIFHREVVKKSYG